jgi:twitching motility two-component system response regulator PilH
MKKKTILVVEDSPTDLKVVTTVLQSKGYSYTVAVDGEEAILKTQQQKPDLVLLDVILPKKNGFHVCRHIKSSPDTRHIKVIVLSGKTQEADRYWGLKQGADEYLTKPVNTEALLGAIARYL